ncbi:MAG: hypothetical protein COV33_02315 [Candidatus Zambryskibacteria bacterium CG10_big_fil_rev_8_21_14_0_10_34_34]|uniref:Uncharacterized protein n=1 Tax=Candidatus Zambryskibacteria bacterium CG10_big_fil_rev_8_21_14_0_10_34_34 TaxID=1975114 RepID=A0A2H0R0E9_9BACT|nr:MAG: hypothetical protein COV33_02315 [Candidatus Zambryskibacteria bacterium CG10_big_fil_rev_8_21_14_0_10_34_34]
MNNYKFEKYFNIRHFIIIFSVIILLSYGVFNARNLIIGPIIEVYSPNQNTETKENLLIIKGRAKNISFLSLNSKPIFVDMEGLFEEKLLLSPGSNIIEIRAKDRFKKEILKTLKVYYKQTATTSTSEVDENNKI